MQVTVERVGDARAPLTCYLLDASDQMPTARVRPAVLVLPGGGYASTSDREAEPVALAYLAEGYHAFVLRYATGPEASFGDALADAEAALAWVRANAGELGVDPSRVAVAGFSAGGHLAGALGTLYADKPDALVLGYPVTVPWLAPDLAKPFPDLAAAVSADTPPTFLFSTCSDATVPIRHSTAFLDALARHGVPFAAQIYLLGEHGLSVAKPHTASGRAAMRSDEVAGWLEASVTFLHQVFGEYPTDGDVRSFADVWTPSRPGLDCVLDRLARSADARRILAARAPQVAGVLGTDLVEGSLTLRVLAQQWPEGFEGVDLDALDADLRALAR